MKNKYQNHPYHPFQQSDKDSTGFLLWQVSTLWQRTIKKALTPLTITQVQFVLLAGILWLEKKDIAITQVMLAKHTKLDIMMTSQVLRTLEKKGYINRKNHPTDTRAKCLTLSKSGKSLTLKAIPLVEKTDQLFFEKIKNISMFNQPLQILIDNAIE